MIELRNITVRYPTSMAPSLNDASLVVPTGKTTVLLGGSGCGKSTIMRAILRVVDLERGSIVMDGRDISTLDKLALRRAIGTVFQGDALFPHLTVRENIALPLRAAGVAKNTRNARADEMMHLVGLEPEIYASRFAHTLSGGQQQRAGVARALAPKPAYLLMDEPFGALDAMTRRKLQTELKHWRTMLNVTIIFVTHDIMEAVSLGDYLAVMDTGKMLQAGTMRHVVEHPASDVVRQLVTTPLQELASFVKDSL
jgi:osmoprotectant transport system ATP-binding protein